MIKLLTINFRARGPTKMICKNTFLMVEIGGFSKKKNGSVVPYGGEGTAGRGEPNGVGVVKR